jgi:transcription elongation factor
MGALASSSETVVSGTVSVDVVEALVVVVGAVVDVVVVLGSVAGVHAAAAIAITRRIAVRRNGFIEVGTVGAQSDYRESMNRRDRRVS